MRQYEFHDTSELEEISNQLARATQHPIHVDLGSEYHGHAGEEVSPEPERPVHQDDLSVVWNNRDDRRAYVSSDRYELVQHREVIDKIRSAVGSTTGSIDFGMIRDYGEKVDGIIVFGDQENATIDMRDLLGDDYIPPEGRPDTDPTAETSQWRDAIGLGMRFRNSFDGGTKVGGSTMGYRYICQNWLVWSEAEIGRVEQIHTHELTEDFFADIIQDVFSVKDETESILVESEEEEFPLTWAPQILEDAGFGRNYQKAILNRLDGHIDNEETTLWRLYNATTSYLDHEVAHDVGNGVYNSRQKRAWNILTMDEIRPPEEEPEELAEAL